MIQRSSTAPIATNARAALTSAGNQSGTRSRTPRRGAGGRAGSATSSASPRAPARRRPAPSRSDRQAAAAMACRPAGRSASAPPPRRPLCRRTGSAIQQAGAAALRADRSSCGMLRRTASASCRASSSGSRARCVATAAPAVQRGEQSVDGPLQHRRMIAELGGFSDRLVDDRIERDDPPDELASNRLRVRQCPARPAPACRQIGP